jgi:hypothetical protein
MVSKKVQRQRAYFSIRSRPLQQNRKELDIGSLPRKYSQKKRQADSCRRQQEKGFKIARHKARAKKWEEQGRWITDEEEDLDEDEDVCGEDKFDNGGDLDREEDSCIEEDSHKDKDFYEGYNIISHKDIFHQDGRYDVDDLNEADEVGSNPFIRSLVKATMRRALRDGK